LCLAYIVNYYIALAGIGSIFKIICFFAFHPTVSRMTLFESVSFFFHNRLRFLSFSVLGWDNAHNDEIQKSQSLFFVLNRMEW
jgi:hypothetical protein